MPDLVVPGTYVGTVEGVTAVVAGDGGAWIETWPSDQPLPGLWELAFGNLGLTGGDNKAENVVSNSMKSAVDTGDLNEHPSDHNSLASVYRAAYLKAAGASPSGYFALDVVDLWTTFSATELSAVGVI